MSWTHGLRRVSELAWEALSTGRCAWESVGDVQLDRRGHVEHVWALGQRRPEENRKSKAACVMSPCGGGGFRAHKASYLSWRHARASKSGSALSRSMRRARARGRPRMMSHFVSHRHATRQKLTARFSNLLAFKVPALRASAAPHVTVRIHSNFQILFSTCLEYHRAVSNFYCSNLVRNRVLKQ